MTMLLKTYHVTVRGFSPIPYYAASAGKARATAWRDYGSAYNCSFKEFLQIATIRRAQDPENLGKKVTVSGLPAYQVPHNLGTGFVRPGCETIFFSHPNDVVDGWPAASGERDT